MYLRLNQESTQIRLCDSAQSMPRSQQRVRKFILLVCGMIAAAISLAGCGGGSAAPRNYAGNYSSSAALDLGRTAAITMVVAPAGTIIGTATVDDGRAAARTRAIVATYALTGSVDLSTGVYSLSGVTQNTSLPATIGIRGTLPLPNSQAAGTLRLVFGSSTFSASISGTANTTTGAQSVVRFSDLAGSNAAGTSYSGTTVAVVQDLPVVGSTTSIVVATPDGKRQVTISLNAVLSAGKTFAAGDGTAIVQYIENGKIWAGQGGQVIVDTVNGSAVTFRVIDVPMSPFPVISGGTSASGSTGTFTLNVNNGAGSSGGGGGTTTSGLTISGSTANTTTLKNGAFTGTPSASKTTGSFTLNGTTYDGQYNVDYGVTGASFEMDLFGLAITNGQVFQVTDPRIHLDYLETSIGRSDADAGTITVDSVSATQIKVTLSGVHFTGQQPATGGFTVSGPIVAPIQ